MSDRHTDINRIQDNLMRRRKAKQSESSTRWFEALAKSWESRARNKKLYGEIYSQALKDCALELQVKALRADSESLLRKETA